MKQRRSTQTKQAEDSARPKTRRALARGILVFAAMLCVFALLPVLLAPADYLLTRMQPDLRPNAGYAEPENMEKGTWTSMEHTGYGNGTAAEKTVFMRAFGGEYAALHTPLEGTTLALTGFVTSREIREDLLSSGAENFWDARFKSDGDLGFFSIYETDAQRRLEKMRVFDGESERSLLHFAKFYYSDDGLLTKQVLADEYERPLSYRTYGYADGRLSRTEDHSGDKTLLGYAEYSYDGAGQTARHYTAAGVFTGHRVRQYDLFGRIRSVETFDEKGGLVSREVYRYRFWERFYSLYGVLLLAVGISVSASLGVAAAKKGKKN